MGQRRPGEDGGRGEGNGRDRGEVIRRDGGETEAVNEALASIEVHAANVGAVAEATAEMGAKTAADARAAKASAAKAVAAKAAVAEIELTRVDA